MDFIDVNSLVLGLLAVCLFAECIILVVRINSLRNKMEAENESVRAEERMKFEKKRNDFEMQLKERELELKGEYEDLLGAARAARREQDEKLAEARAELQNAKASSERAEAEFKRYRRQKELYADCVREYVGKLARLSGEDVELIKKSAKEEIEKACALELENYRGEVLNRSMLDVDSQAKRILLDAMQRLSGEMPASATCAIVSIGDEAMKGRLIGKEGRNIRSFEAETGTTLVVDDTPNSVMISSFNPSRRAIAKLALEELVADGRINPTSIEAAVSRAKEKISQLAYDAGLEAAESLGLARVNPDILSLLGHLSFHLSLNQNTLLHSVETARFAGMIAVEMEYDASIAKRAGLFHDIGKAIAASDLSHARAGAEALRRAGESEIVANAVEAHHGEVAAASVYAAIVKLADSISATRTGARMEAAEGYVKRIRTLENLATSFEGVDAAYVLQAGRELRVIVSPDEVDDAAACALSSKICAKIEESVGNSIPVKITIIRERRFTKTANLPRG